MSVLYVQRTWCNTLVVQAVAVALQYLRAVTLVDYIDYGFKFWTFVMLLSSVRRTLDRVSTRPDLLT